MIIYIFVFIFFCTSFLFSCVLFLFVYRPVCCFSLDEIVVFLTFDFIYDPI